MAVICVVNARKTFAEYQKFLKEVKYVAWNKEISSKNSLNVSMTPGKSEQIVNAKKSPLQTAVKCDQVDHREEKGLFPCKKIGQI